MRKTLLCGTCLWLALSGAAKAQLVTGTTVTTDANGNVTQTQTTTASGPSAANTIATAESAEVSAAKAAIPGSGITPGTTIGAAAGTEEGNLLAAISTRAAARHITETINKPNVLVFVGATSSPDVTPWLLFQDQSDRLLQQFKDHEDALKNLIHPPGIHADFVIGVGAAIATSLISYGYTSYQTGGVSLTPDDYLMDVSLVQLQPGWQIYAQRVDLGLPDGIKTRIASLDTEAVASSNLIIQGQRYIAALSLPKYKNDKTAQEKKAEATADISALTADISSYTTFTTALTGLSSSGNGALTAILQAYAVYSALHDPTAGVAYIKVHSASVGAQSKANFVSNLFSMPFYTSIGLVVSYVYYPGTAGAVIAPTAKAGVFEVMTPYHTVGTVKTALELDGEGKCLSQQPNADSNPSDPVSVASRLCPRIYPTP